MIVSQCQCPWVCDVTDLRVYVCRFCDDMNHQDVEAASYENDLFFVQWRDFAGHGVTK